MGFVADACKAVGHLFTGQIDKIGGDFQNMGSDLTMGIIPRHEDAVGGPEDVQFSEADVAKINESVASFNSALGTNVAPMPGPRK